MTGLWRLAADLLFPPRCVFCGEVVPIGVPGCAGCVAELHRMDEAALCRVCGKGPRDCVCTPEPFAFVRCVSPFAYEGRVRFGIIDLKRSAASAAVGFFADEMARRAAAEYAGVAFGGVTYVPASPGNARGFNQAALLAEAVAARLGLICFAPPAAKLPGTAAQHTRGYRERLENARAGYVPAAGRVSGTLLLVDDVMTTGATLGRCAALLRQAGADAVYCVAAAATLRHSAGPADTDDLKEAL